MALERKAFEFYLTRSEPEPEEPPEAQIARLRGKNKVLRNKLGWKQLSFDNVGLEGSFKNYWMLQKLKEENVELEARIAEMEREFAFERGSGWW